MIHGQKYIFITLDRLMHCFFTCDKNREAAAAMMPCARVGDEVLTPEKILTLQVKAGEVCMVGKIAMITTGLGTIWVNRQVKMITTGT